MSFVNIVGVNIPNNDVSFFSNFEFEITLECLSELKDDLEFKVVYVCSATGKRADQVLESVSVGPIPAGVNRFTLETPPPNPATIDAHDLLDVTVVFLQVSYMGCEFTRIGYLVNNEYKDPALVADPPAVPLLDKIFRNILAEKPRVTRFHINWENPKATFYPAHLDEADTVNAEAHAMVTDAAAAAAAAAASAAMSGFPQPASS
ncbi:Histone chaperone asf1 [Blastocladiella emersonii ATCC 22665]|nr:Histone chaperone asf1 [Blastocladiella emersonii ATCC 22665]